MRRKIYSQTNVYPSARAFLGRCAGVQVCRCPEMLMPGGSEKLRFWALGGPRIPARRTFCGVCILCIQQSICETSWFFGIGGSWQRGSWQRTLGGTLGARRLAVQEYPPDAHFVVYVFYVFRNLSARQVGFGIGGSRRHTHRHTHRHTV